ncbi:MAG: recG, partial [Clostridia bacterium]|nr:recG [Clostridia bacterium]
GFAISQKDLELRGPGDFFGSRQHGLPEFKIANLTRDMSILKDVQETAKTIFADPIWYQTEENIYLRDAVTRFFKTIDGQIVFN